MPIIDESEYTSTDYLDIGHLKKNKEIKTYVYIFSEDRKLLIKKATAKGHNAFPEYFNDNPHQPHDPFLKYYALGRIEINKNKAKASVVFSGIVSKSFYKKHLKFVEKQLSTYLKSEVDIYVF
jgi:hypothetical protein